MKSELFSGFFVFLFLISMVGLAFNIHPTKAATLFVPDGYSTIQAAVNAAAPGDTIIVRAGIYTENVEVIRNHLALKSEGGAELTIIQPANPLYCVFGVIQDYVEINGFTVTGATFAGISGIRLDRVQYCKIINNNVSGNFAGITLLDSSNNNIKNNTANFNENHGIFLADSDNNIVTNNTANSNSFWGITLTHSSSNNIIADNNISKNENGIRAIWNAENNAIYLNNITNNRGLNGYSYTSSNIWNSPEEITYTYEGKAFTKYMGNYWSDYAGWDGNGDGIGDTPYIIDANNRDRCPLMKPWDPASPPVGNCFVPHKVKVMFGANDVREMVLDEYVKGVVSAELYHGLGWPIEALKAQAVAARTFAVRTTQHNHVTEDVCIIENAYGPHCQAWEAGPYNQNIEDAVSQTHNQVITYNGWILKQCMFFAWCNGHTVDSEDRFPDPYPYIRGVSCNGAKCMQYRTMYNPETCPYLTSGNDISTCNCKLYHNSNPGEGGYYGHRVGMCQEGAKTMAQNDYSYVDIIKHYYTDVGVVTAATAETRIIAKPQSPIELSLSDSQNRVTGLVNGFIRSEIPNSEYDQESELLTIFLPEDQYRYSVTGADVGVYGLILANATEQETTFFESDNIPIEINATHQYTVDWAALSVGEEGVSVSVDADGDSVFEYDFTSDSELSRTEYVAATTGHDLDVTGVTSSKSVVGEGYTVPVNATITNYGVYTETFTITLYANTTVVASQVIAVANASSATIAFTWNTNGFARGNYTLSAMVDQVPGETYTADNTLIGGWVVVTLPGDVDGDKYVDIFDIVRMAGVYGTETSNPQYDTNCDIDGDGDIDIFDIVAAATHYGETW